MDGSSNFYPSVSPVNNDYTFGVNEMSFKIVKLQQKVYRKLNPLKRLALNNSATNLGIRINNYKLALGDQLKSEAGVYGAYDFGPKVIVGLDPGDVFNYDNWVGYVPNINSSLFKTQFVLPGLFTQKADAITRDTVVAGGTTIDNFKPQSHDQIAILYAAVNGSKTNQDLIINYADGSQVVKTFDATDWANGVSDLSSGEKIFYNSGGQYLGQAGNPRVGGRFMFYRIFDLDPGLDVASLGWNTDGDTRLIAATFIG